MAWLAHEQLACHPQVVSGTAIRQHCKQKPPAPTILINIQIYLASYNQYRYQMAKINIMRFLTSHTPQFSGVSPVGPVSCAPIRDKLVSWVFELQIAVNLLSCEV
jgi:hypothetical protein